MAKHEWRLWEAVIEAVALIAMLMFFGLQIYYGYAYESSIERMLYHILPVVFLYAALTVLEIFPELLNGRNSAPLKGMVRIYAVRMARNIKCFLVLGMIVPSVADVLGILVNGAFSLAVMGSILLNIGYYLYRIYRHNAGRK